MIKYLDCLHHHEGEPATPGLAAGIVSWQTIRPAVPNHFAEVSRSQPLSSRIQCSRPLFRFLAIEFVEHVLDYPLSLVVHW